MKPTLLVHLMPMSAVKEEIRNAKTKEPNDEVENCANEGAPVLSATVAGLLSIMW
jgi:hypothetical protein